MLYDPTLCIRKAASWEISELRQRPHVGQSERLQELLGRACQSLSVGAQDTERTQLRVACLVLE